MRDSPAAAVAQALIDAGVSVAAYDPEDMELAALVVPRVTVCASSYCSLKGADAAAIATEWDAFRELDLAGEKDLMTALVLNDLRII